MRADADLMVFVAARWPALVKEAVRLGCPPEHAADATTEALSRCRREWARASRDEDVDHLVHEALVTAVARRASTDPGLREDAAHGLLVLAPPTLEDLLRRQREREAANLRRSARVAVPGLVALAAVVAYLALHTDGPDRPDAERLGPAPATRAENPAPGVAWYAAGRLHLDHVVLEVAGVRDMTRLGAGVVYGDDQGRVVYAADDGSRALLGHKDPAVPVAATDETGLAAWYDPETEEVVVVEAASGNLRVRTGVGDAPEVVAVDGDVVYLVGDRGARALLPTGPASQVPVSPAGLLDVRSRIRAFQKAPATVQVIQSAFNLAFDVVGEGADLSPDGDLVATRSPGDGALLVYDTRSGREVDVGLAPGDQVLAVAPGSRGTIAYVVAPEGRAAELRTCLLRTGPVCTDVADLPDTGDPPVLAR